MLYYYRMAITYGCQLVDEFEDDINEITKVFPWTDAIKDTLQPSIPSTRATSSASH